MSEVSIANYQELKRRVEKRTQHTGAFTQSLFDQWLNEVIFDIERTVACRYTHHTAEFDLEAGTNKVLTPRLLTGKEHTYSVSIMETGADAPCPVSKLSALTAGMDRTYPPEQWGVPQWFYPVSVPDADDKRVPGLLLLPVPSVEVSKLYVLGFFLSELPAAWTDDLSHWLIDNHPDLVVAGICRKANVALRQYEQAQSEFAEYSLALLGDNDTGRQGLLQLERAARLPDLSKVRMRLAPDIVSARDIGIPDYVFSDPVYEDDPYYDYANQKYVRLR